MVCPACGASLVDGVKFCARCGAAVAAPSSHSQQQPSYSAAPPPIAGHYGVPYTPPSRVERNLQTTAILWFVYAGYRALTALVGIFFLHAFVGHGFGAPGWPFSHGFDGNVPRWLSAVMPVIAVYTAFSVALAIFLGWSLLKRKPWGRTLAIVAAVLALLKFPLGTALGIYTLWVMVPSQSGLEWDAIADRT